jgi:hypothetical protein
LKPFPANKNLSLTDADTFITTPTVPIHLYLPPPNMQPEPQLLASVDGNGLNAGVLLVKITFANVELFSRVLTEQYSLEPHKHVLNDQASLSRILDKNRDTIAKHFYQIPAIWFNTYASASSPHLDQSVQAHLVNTNKYEHSHFGYVEHSQAMLEKAGFNHKNFNKQKEYIEAKANAAIFWQSAQAGVEQTPLMTEG